MAMKPGMMMVMQRMAERPSRSEYSGGDRRMIGYDRGGYGGGMRGAYDDWPRNEYDGGMYPGERPMMMGDYRMNYPVENRRRSPRTGRFIRGEYESPTTRMGGYDRPQMGDDDDEDDDRRRYAPSARAGNSYGDIYAEGTIYAPGAMNRPHGGMDERHMREVDEHTAHEWVKRMENADGSKGPHYKIDQVEQWRSTNCMDCDKWEFFVAVNMMYADYCKTAEKMGMNKIDFYGSLAKDFLHDPDAGPHKLQKYMEHIAA